jgi:hypothetical protein
VDLLVEMVVQLPKDMQPLQYLVFFDDYILVAFYIIILNYSHFSKFIII